MINAALKKIHRIVKDHLIIINNNNYNQIIQELHQNHVMEQIIISNNRFSLTIST